jgi:transposase
MGSQDYIIVVREQARHIGLLEKEITELRKEIIELKGALNSLKEQLSKNSRNSSKPPSSDGLKKKMTKSLREPSGKKNGGQKGHTGHTLERVEAPDITVIHKVNECKSCECSLGSVETYNLEGHQVFDVPECKIEVTEHQAEMKRCPKCGFMNKAEFPPEAANITQYGNGISALVAYFSNYQLIPLKRVGEIFADLFKRPVSKATLIKMNQKTYEALEMFDIISKEKIRNSKVVHVDESGLYCEKKRLWLHCASTEKITHYLFHPKRGKTATDEIGILPGFNGTLVHDFWRPYFKYPCAHALCNAHHLRELTFFIEEKKAVWAADMKKLLLQIKETVDNARARADGLSEKIIKDFEKHYDQILEQGMKANPPPSPGDSDLPKKRGRKKKSKALNFLIRFKENKEKVLAFMYNFEVPFDNNLAERDIRMVKLQQKISGTFRTDQGAKYFCRIRSYISTVKKNGINVSRALKNAIRGYAFTP